MHINHNPEEAFYNPNGIVWLMRTEDADNPGSLVTLGDVAQQILDMDMSPQLRNSHIAGLCAAQLALSYLDTRADPVSEKALDMGMLAMLGLYITDEIPLTDTEIDTADTYQKQIIFWRVLDDPPLQGVYSVSNSRKHDSVMSSRQFAIRLNPFYYLDGRLQFSQEHDAMVQDYIDAIRNTQPTDEALAYYRGNNELTTIVNRFIQQRRSLQNYVPTLVAIEEELWRYARDHYARHYLKNN